MVSSLPDGLDTLVGDRGYRLSGGEKQRVAIARLLLKAPDVVVLDEATAHLDSESEVAVQRALKKVLAGRTSIVIAHRLSTVRDADQILVIDAGHIVERGRHTELLMAGGLYAELYNTQFAEQDTDDEDEDDRAGEEAVLAADEALLARERGALTADEADLAREEAVLATDEADLAGEGAVLAGQEGGRLSGNGDANGLGGIGAPAGVPGLDK